MTAAPQIARKIELETERYVLRTIEQSDAASGLGQWLLDPAAARWLNAKPRAATPAELKQYIASFDGKASHLIGVFEKDSGRLIGIYSMYVDWPRSEYLFNVLIGEADARNHGARRETRTAIHQFFMDELDLHASLATIMAGHPNIPALLQWGWVVENRSVKPSATGGAPIEFLHLRLSRKAWHRWLRAQK